MFSDKVTQARHYGLVASVSLAMGLQTVCSSSQVLDTEKAAHLVEELVCKLESVAGQQELRYPIEDNPGLKEHLRDVCRRNY